MAGPHEDEDAAAAGRASAHTVRAAYGLSTPCDDLPTLVALEAILRTADAPLGGETGRSARRERGDGAAVRSARPKRGGGR